MIGYFTDRTVLASAVLVILYTFFNATADTAAKIIAAEFAAPQLLAISGGLVCLFTVCASLKKNGVSEFKTKVPGVMAIRSALTVASATFFFWAFATLTLAEIFIFVGLMPIMAALLTPAVLKESANGKAWVALLAGFFGVVCLFPEGISTVKAGHLWAFLASFSGVASIVLSRVASRKENKPLALVFYPNAAMFLVMGLALPFVYKPMTLGQFAIVVGYAFLFFVGRYLLVKAAALAPAHVVTPLMNTQFLWMVILGATVFGEIPTVNVLLGATLVIGACIKLVIDEARAPKMVPIRVFPDADPLRRGRWPRPRSSFRSRTNSWHSDSESQTARQSILR